MEISSHNHGYAIDRDSLPSFAAVTHTNLNDKTVEGFEVKSKERFRFNIIPRLVLGLMTL